jgi:hypothetical protein
MLAGNPSIGRVDGWHSMGWFALQRLLHYLLGLFARRDV